MTYAAELPATHVPGRSGGPKLRLPSRTAVIRFARASAPLVVAAVGVVAWAALSAPRAAPAGRPTSLGRDLRDGTTVTAPGAVIIPIAIYK